MSLQLPQKVHHVLYSAFYQEVKWDENTFDDYAMFLKLRYTKAKSGILFNTILCSRIVQR